MDKDVAESIDLFKKALNTAQLCNKNLLTLMMRLDPTQVSIIFENNPIFYQGEPRDVNESEEHYYNDQLKAVLSTIHKAHAHMLEVETLLRTLGIDYVRFKAGTRLP